MRFIADHMLGKLAKYLRLADYDVIYPPPRLDRDKRQLAIDQKRILLTRSTPLIRNHPGPQYLLIASGKFREQLQQVIRHFNLHLDPERFFRRCLICNAPVTEISKERIRDRVPPKSYAAYDQFCQCPHCQRIYWRGSHTQRMMDALLRLVAPQS